MTASLLDARGCEPRPRDTAARREAAAPDAADASAPPVPAPQAVYDAYRRQIEHEDNLVGQRSSWLLMAESFFVMGYCILHQLAPPDRAAQPVTPLLTALIPWLGLLTAVSILVSVAAAARVMRRLRSDFEQLCGRSAGLAALAAALPPVQPVGGVLLLGRVPTWALPALLIGFWLTMIVASAAL